MQKQVQFEIRKTDLRKSFQLSILYILCRSPLIQTSSYMRHVYQSMDIKEKTEWSTEKERGARGYLRLRWK